nr:immunoglobulin heavy chain junction region [Mus musculus]
CARGIYYGKGGYW